LLSNVEIKKAIQSGTTTEINWNALRSSKNFLDHLEQSYQMGISDTFNDNSVLTFTPMLQPV
jgi:hypothetical protein